MSNIQIFCDFDGTITKEDTLNKFLKMYAGKKWLEIEDDWENGKIGSRECIYEQMKLVPKQSAKTLSEFINGIEIDETFFEFYEYVKKNNIDFYIVSDGFEYFINRILKRNNIHGIKIFSNYINLEEEQYISEFPHMCPECESRSGMCKCEIVKKYKKPGSTIYYIGDGRSDFCVSKKMKTIFAKGSLLEYCKFNNIACEGLIQFENFREIINHIS